MKFRTDINGLRALAVIAVVLFHFNPSWVPGGFAGVDVFFVISGFLMTGLIFRGLENNNFSIINFYVARANRIIPALSVVCLALLVFGWFYLIPLDYSALGKHVTSSMGFVSNIIYWRESGYFDAASHSKWLLHTWSLSVEWQFYMIYPVVLVLLKKCISLTNIKCLLVVGTVIGFIFSVYTTYRWPNPAYFLFPTRAWEMMMGGLAFLYPLQSLKETSKKYLEWAGIALILASYAFISKDNLWPGYLALIPVLGAYLVILANRNGSVITDNIVMQKVGLWSYSIYLWHWPVVVFGYYFEMQHWEWIGIPVSVVLGFCSYKFVESIKFPALASISFKPIVMFKPLWMVVSIGLVSSFVFITKGVESHYPQSVNIAIDEAYNKNPYHCMLSENERSFVPCIIGNKSNIKAIIVGDSHADAITTSITSLFNLKTEGVVALTRASCPFILDINVEGNNSVCKEDNKKRVEFINSHPNTRVFIVSRLGSYIYGQSNPDRITKEYTGPVMYWNKKYNEASDDYYMELSSNIKRTIKEINNKHTLYMTTPIPEMRVNVPKLLSKEIMRHGKLEGSYSLNFDLFKSRNQKIITMMHDIGRDEKVIILDPYKELCVKSKCISNINGRPIYYDGDHMSEFGNKLLSPMFKSALTQDIPQNTQS